MDEVLAWVNALIGDLMAEMNGAEPNQPITMSRLDEWHKIKQKIEQPARLNHPGVHDVVRLELKLRDTNVICQHHPLMTPIGSNVRCSKCGAIID